MEISHFTAWDIGGAHLKVACVDNTGKLKFVEQFATPLWQGLERLEDIFPIAIKRLPQGPASHVFTMTAELVDIFEDRHAGMNALLELCEKNMGNNINLYGSSDGILNLDEAKNKLDKVASANWHASAEYTASLIETGVFVDIGSTTTDIIPFCKNTVSNRGVNDQTRLRFDELVYTGVIRTPIMALTNRAPFAGEWQNIASESFATTADIYRILSCLEDGDDLMETADGNDKTVVNSIRRLARMMGTDVVDSVNQNDWYKLAGYFEEIQIQTLTKSLLRVLSNLTEDRPKLVGAGVGRFLIKKIAQRLSLPYVEFSDLFETETEMQHQCNICAPAVALAHLNRLSNS
jgi:(4-(4-[2-(gamma-L-glutamylamino)ethyl]phenoxymethyl)furan-2-yl)methanamine synthase